MRPAGGRNVDQDGKHPIPKPPPVLQPVYLSPDYLEKLDRQLTGLLYLIWQTRGINKIIVKVDNEQG